MKREDDSDVEPPPSFKQACIRRWQFEQESRTCRMTFSLSTGSFVNMAKTIPKPELTKIINRKRPTSKDNKAK